MTPILFAPAANDNDNGAVRLPALPRAVPVLWPVAASLLASCVTIAMTLQALVT